MTVPAATPQGASADEILLTSADLAERWRMTLDAIQQMRFRGGGPPFILLGKRVRYRLRDVRAHEDQRFNTVAVAQARSPEAAAQAERMREIFLRKVRPKAMAAKAKLAAERRRERAKQEYDR